MVDAAKISPHVPSSCNHNAILSSLIIHIIQSRQIYVAIGNPLLFPSVCKNAYASVRLNRDMVANVDSSEYICRRVGKIIAGDLRLVASRLYRMAVTLPWTHHVQPCRYTVSCLTTSSHL